MNPEKKVALITGANKGIGLETARQLGRLGIAVVLGARGGKADSPAQELRQAGIDALPLELDITREQDRAAAVQFLESRFGKLDILVNNAGSMTEGTWGMNTTSTISPEILRQTFETNFFAPVLLTQQLLPLLKKANPPARIVNLSSIMGSLTEHSNPRSPIFANKPFGYDASKTALNAFTIHLANELRDTGIKVNSAHPGWVKTDMGTDAAPMDIVQGAKTSVELATLPEHGPTGAYLHLGKPLPW